MLGCPREGVARFDFGSGKVPIPPDPLGLSLSQKLVKGNESKRNAPLPGLSPPQTQQTGRVINLAELAHGPGAV